MKKVLLVALFLCANVFAAPQIGDNVTDFKLPNLYNLNQELSSTDFKGNVILLNLWASWCGGCKEEMPLFVELQEEFKESNFKILLSSIDKDPQSAISFLNGVDQNRVLNSFYDKEKTLPKAYKCMGMPSSYLIDANGKLVDIFIGSIDEDSLAKLKIKIKSLLGK
ncbi:TlpA family protein disulfide reductase [bacterium]|nr:TlpA family protein disulfide reductase [bacterium]MBU1989765.1 TlpA family protein disulfide reductase [bacterium]